MEENGRFNEFNFNLGSQIEDEKLKLETQAASLGQRTDEELEEERVRTNVIGNRPERDTDLRITNTVQWMDAREVKGVHVWDDCRGIPGLEVDQTGKYYRLKNDHGRVFVPAKNYEGKDAIAAEDKDWEYYLVGGTLNTHRHLTLEQVKQIELEMERQGWKEEAERPEEKEEDEGILTAEIKEYIKEQIRLMKQELVEYIDSRMTGARGARTEGAAEARAGSPRGKVVVDGVEMTLTEAAKMLGVDRSNLGKKLKNGLEREIFGRKVRRLE